MNLYLIHDIDYYWKVITQANNSAEAIENMHRWFDDTKQNGKYFASRNVNWIIELCD